MFITGFAGHIPLEDSARDGALHLVSDPEGAHVGLAYWTGEMWAQDPAQHDGKVKPIDFEPTHFLPPA